MENKLVLRAGVDTFTTPQLLERVATHKGLTTPIAVYTVDSELLDFLAVRNIKRQPRLDGIFTIVDKNWQEKAPGWSPSCYWNFWKGDDEEKLDLHFSLYAQLMVNMRERGVTLWPRVSGSGGSAVDHLPNFRLFKALVESGRAEVPALAQELARSEGHIVVLFADLGLGGIRRMSDLFEEFAHQNDVLKQIANNGCVFDPQPEPHFQKSEEKLFVVEPMQPKVFAAWRTQLEAYRTKLAA